VNEDIQKITHDIKERKKHLLRETRRLKNSEPTPENIKRFWKRVSKFVKYEDN